MPGFTAALDQEVMARLFQKHWLGAHARCRGVSVVRFRHRPGRRLIVVYEVDVSQAAHPPKRRLTVTGRIHPQRKLRARKARDIADGGGPLPEAAVLPEIEMAIEVFPRDRRLPALRDLMDPRSPASVALFNRRGVPRPIEPGPLSTRLVRYRPGLSATLRISGPSTAADRPSHCFVKITSDDEIAHEIEAAGRVNAVLDGNNRHGLRLAEPVAWLCKSNVAVYLPAAGVALDRMIIAGGFPPETAMVVAKALAELHRLDVPALQGSHDLVLKRKIERACGLIRWALPGLCREVGVIGEDAERLIAMPALGPTHRDMKPEHIFIDRDGGCVHLIDSGSLCLANPVIDIAALSVRLEHLAHVHALSTEHVKTFSDAVLSCYFDRVPPAWRDCLGPAMSYATLLLAIHLIQGLKPRWAGIVERLILDAARRAGEATGAEDCR